VRAKSYTTVQAAKLIGVSRQTLQTWIAAGQIVAPEPVEIGDLKLRIWTARDIERAKKFKGTLKPGPKPKRGAE
jgi:excisionase family DNA binding protein